MQQLTVPFLHALTSGDAISTVADRLREGEKQTLSFAPWAKADAYQPDVTFAIAHGPEALLLQFDVKEKTIRAACGHTNEPVYKDSCVEFFVSFDDGIPYYNFEFNCIGTVLAGYGTGRTDRQPLPPAALEEIKSGIVINRGGGEKGVHWEITVLIPFSVFLYHPLSSLQGRRCRGNFYKCGDELPEPHFLSWSDIESGEPEFHLPRFFGALHFV